MNKINYSKLIAIEIKELILKLRPMRFTEFYSFYFHFKWPI